MSDQHEPTCKHCGCTISRDEWPVHTSGSYTGKHRCGSESQQPYGLEAAPVGTACTYPCYAAPDGPLFYTMESEAGS